MSIGDTAISSNHAPAWPLQRILIWIGAGVVTLAFAMCLRYLVIEPHDIGIACASADAPWWCAPRQAVVMMHIWNLWGWIGLGGGVFGLILGWRIAVQIGFVMSLMGLVLYNADFASIGFVLTCLRLPRV